MNLRRWLTLIVGVSFLAIAAPTKAWIVWPSSDVYIDQNYPDKPHCDPTEGNRIAYFSPAGTRIRTLIGGIYVPVSQADRDTLHIRAGNGMVYGTYRISAYLITSSWDECTVTWSGQPSYDFSVKGEYVGSLWTYWDTDGWWYAIPITEIVRAWVTGRSNYGIMLELTPIENPGGMVELSFLNENHEMPPNVTYDGQVHAPTACFTANPRSGEAPLTVTFTNCTQNAYLWNWEFGDGGQFVGQSPLPYTYNTPGTYEVWLTAQNHDESDRAKDTITVIPPGEDDPICTVSPLTLPFGEVYIGDCPTKTFTITNTGEGTLTGTVSESCSSFEITSPIPPNYSLGAGQSQTFTVEFCPDVEMSYQCTIETGTNCDDNDNVVASGTGIPPSLTHPYWIDLESVDVGFASYDPSRLPMSIDLGTPIRLHGILRDKNNQPVNTQELLGVYDFVNSVDACQFVVPGADGRLTWNSNVARDVNSNFRGIMIRTGDDGDEPLLVGFHVRVNDRSSLVGTTQLDSMFQNLSPELYRSLELTGFTATNAVGDPIYETPLEHWSQALEGVSISQLVTDNLYPILTQIGSWYGYGQLGPFGLEGGNVEAECDGKIATALSVGVAASPAELKTMVMTGLGAICTAKIAKRDYRAAIGCAVALKLDDGLETARKIALGINAITEDADRLLREQQILEAPELSLMLGKFHDASETMGDVIGVVDEVVHSSWTGLYVYVYNAAAETAEGQGSPFTNCTATQQPHGLGWEHEYRFTYNNIQFVLKVIDPCSLIEPCTAIEGETPISPPLSTSLFVAPNPFNPATQIAFSVETEGLCTVAVYDAAGRKVKTILEQTLSPGTHAAAWDGTDASGRMCASGSYIVSFETKGTSIQRRAVMLK
jgi:PKD repeat protein